MFDTFIYTFILFHLIYWLIDLFTLSINDTLMSDIDWLQWL